MIGARRARLSGVGWLILGTLIAGCATASPTAPISLPTEQPASVPTQPSATQSTDQSSPAVDNPLNAELIEPGRLVICSAFPRTRYAEYDSEGRPVGFDIELALAIAERLGVEPEVTELPFDQLIDAIIDGSCDIAVSGHFITHERLARIDLIPYREGSVNVVVRAGNPLGIATLDDLCGRTAAIVAGTIYVDIVRGAGDYEGRGIDQGCDQAGRPPVGLSEHLTEADAVAFFGGGDADVFIGNEAVAVERPGEFDRSDAELPRLRNGIGHRMGASALDEAVRSALRSLIEDGTYELIRDRYDLGPINPTELP